MKVEARAHIRNEDVRRALNRSEAVYGDVMDLEDGVAEVYVAQGLVVPVKVPHRASPAVEVAANSGAPETALSRRGRAKIQPTSSRQAAGKEESE